MGLFYLPKIMHTLITYLRHVREELKHVTWPPRHQAIAHTLLVIAISIVTALIISVFDYIYTSGIAHLIGA